MILIEDMHNYKAKYIRVGFETLSKGTLKGTEDKVARVTYNQDGSITSVMVMHITNVIADLNLYHSNSEYWYKETKKLEEQLKKHEDFLFDETEPQTN